MDSAFETFGPNQGVVGVTRTLTIISWPGPGPLITATKAPFEDYWIAGKFAGFSISGPYGSGTTSGIEYSNLQGIIIDDVFFYGLPGGAIIGTSNGGWSEEGELTRLNITECGATSGFVFGFSGTSFDYTHIDAVVVVEANIDILSISGGGGMIGLDLSLRGNCHGGTGTNTGAIIAIERGNSSGTANIRYANFAVSMEADESPGIVGHYLLWMGSSNGNSQFSAGGVFNLFFAGANCQGGVGKQAPGNPNFLPASFSGVTNDEAGGSMVSDALAVMGGTAWTTANFGAGHTIDWQVGDVAATGLSSGSNTLVFDGASGFIRRVELILYQPASGADGTVVWPSSVKWPGGTPPTLSTVNGYTDIVHFTYIPEAGFWLGTLQGVNYA
jgi:hypothetical protein